jgi:hypothetical protein
MQIAIHQACKLGFEIFEIRVNGIVERTFMSYEIAKTTFDRMVMKMHLEAAQPKIEVEVEKPSLEEILEYDEEYEIY